MIPLARPTVPPVAITILAGTFFVLRDFEKWGRKEGRTDRQHVIPTDRGSAEWINIHFPFMLLHPNRKKYGKNLKRAHA